MRMASSPTAGRQSSLADKNYASIIDDQLHEIHVMNIHSNSQCVLSIFCVSWSTLAEALDYFRQTAVEAPN